MEKKNIAVIGAGVAGLTTALLLSRTEKYRITVLAKHMPGDYDIEYASPWAGANYLPVSKAGTEASEWDRATWLELNKLASNIPEAGIHFQETLVYNREKDKDSVTGQWFSELSSPNPWFKDLLPNFGSIPNEKLLPGMSSGITFTSVCINTAIYLPWLVSQCLKNGVSFKRAVLHHIEEAVDFGKSGKKADLLVNCTGLGSLKLGGVEDRSMIPARGQITVVRNSPGVMMSSSGTDDADDEALYIMERAAGGGTVLGGSYEKGSWESQPDLNLATRIMKRCVDLCPALTGGKGVEALSVIRHSVGLRPLRSDGVRLEKEKIGGNRVVHNYGHGGFGYQSSYGCAQVAVRLVEDSLGLTE